MKEARTAVKTRMRKRGKGTAEEDEGAEGRKVKNIGNRESE
jgi:hypothetical protein